MSAQARLARPAPAPQAPHGPRGERQRARILDAAERCFIESGFHAASIAHIAAAAGISPGLIYRYFSSKNDIVRTIVERHLATDGCSVMQRLNTREDFSARMLEVFESWRRRDNPHMNAALMLELIAEAARDPEILEIVRGVDRVAGKDLTVAVQRAAREEGTRLSAESASLRVVMLQCLFEGLACRVVQKPELDSAALRPLLDKVIAALLA